MKALVYINSVHGGGDGGSLILNYHVDNDISEHISSELIVPATSTDAQANQAVIDDARTRLETAAGTIFSIGDEILLVNALTFFKSIVTSDTDPAVVSAPSLNDQLNTLLTS